MDLPAGKSEIRILLADDHAMFRTGLTALLEDHADIRVIGEAESGREAVALAFDLKPDVVLMDITMRDMDGLEATRQIRERFSDIKVLILTMHEDSRYLRRSLEAGSSGYIVKRAADTELVSAIRTVSRGDIFVYPSMTRTLLDTLVQLNREVSSKGEDPPPEPEGSYDQLSLREKEVFRMLVLGYTNKEIAERLFITVKTVESHKLRIKKKMGFRRRSDLIRFALKHKLFMEDETND